MDFERAFFNNKDYELTEKKLGQGIFGPVYVARNLHDNQNYAAKIIQTDSGFDGQDQMILFRESIIQQKINHPSIVKIKGINFQSFTNPKVLEPTILSEYLPNGSLKEIINKEKKSISDFHWNSTKKYIALLGISDSMRYLHKHGIFHRDLKLENILIDENYYPKVSDFYLARCFPDCLSKSSNFTPSNMSPEILKGEEINEAAADVYSFSILAYEIITGKSPFYELGESSSLFVLANKIMSGYRPKFDDDLTEKMKILLSKCWSANIEERPSFDEIFEQLSTDFSYFNEKVDSEEIQNFLNKLKEQNVDLSSNKEMNVSSQQLQNLLTIVTEENQSLQVELIQLKNKIKSYQNQIKNLNKLSEDFFLALNTIHGNQKEKNPNQSITYLKKSSEKGNPYGSYLLGLLYENGENIEKNLNEASKCFLQSSKQGNSFGFNRIAFYFCKGIGVEKDYAKMREFLQKAADIGNSQALFNLGKCYFKGIGVCKDYAKSIQFFEKSAQLGNSFAFNDLGFAHEKGLGVVQNFSKAIEFYQKAGDLGNSIAYYNLGLMFETGYGVGKDKSKAIEYYQKAAKYGVEKAQEKLKHLMK